MSAPEGRTLADVERSENPCGIRVIIYFGGRRRMHADVHG
jgi:hypothetical protein